MSFDAFTALRKDLVNDITLLPPFKYGTVPKLTDDSCTYRVRSFRSSIESALIRLYAAERLDLTLLNDPQLGGLLIQSSFRGLLTTFPREREIVTYVGACFKSYHTLAPQPLLGFVNVVIEAFGEDEMPRTAKEAFKNKFAK